MHHDAPNIIPAGCKSACGASRCAASGTHAWVSSELVNQPPGRDSPDSEALDQREFPCAAPALQTGLTGASFRDGCVLLNIHQQDGYRVSRRTPAPPCSCARKRGKRDRLSRRRTAHPGACSRECKRSIVCAFSVSFRASAVPDAAQHQQRRARKRFPHTSTCAAHAALQIREPQHTPGGRAAAPRPQPAKVPDQRCTTTRRYYPSELQERVRRVALRRVRDTRL